MDIALIQKVQKVQIEIMDEIHNLCVANGVNYYIIGGTALGAIRHKGFIPWDIDIDIAMQRKDYDKFIRETSKLLPAKYRCVSWESDENYFPPHACVSLVGSTITQKDDHLNPHLKRYGIFVDIFPLDKCPESDAERAKQAESIQKMHILKSRKMAIIDSSNSLPVRFAKKAISLCMLPVSLKLLNAKLDKIFRLYDDMKNATCLCSMASHYSYKKQCMPREVYGTPKLIEFEGREYYAPEMIDDYLTRIYGNYMQEPSEADKKFIMDFFTDAKW